MINSAISGLNLINLSIILIWTFLASLGVPGGLVWIISSGALANNIMELIIIMIVSAIGSIVGDLTAYEVARRYSSPLYTGLSKLKFFRNGESKSRVLFKRYGFSLIFFSRFAITGLCVAVSYISGFEKLNRKKFISAVVFGELLYGLIYPLMGFVFKETWIDLASVIQDVLVIAVLIIITLIFLKYVRNNSK